MGVSILTTLTDLDLNNTFIYDESILYLKPLINLKRLCLGFTRITGGTIEHLTNLQNLNFLELSYSCEKIY